MGWRFLILTLALALGVSLARAQQGSAPSVEAYPSVLMSARFAEACTATGANIGPLQCPYREAAECVGEGCFVDGIRQSLREIPLFEAPGSERTVYTLSVREHVYAETTDVYVVPCLSTVLGGWPQVDNGETVYRLGYSGEGAYRYWIKNGVVSSWLEAKIRDEQGCIAKSEEWVRIKTRSGIVGWTSELDGLLGSSRYDDPVDPPPSASD